MKLDYMCSDNSNLLDIFNLNKIQLLVKIENYIKYYLHSHAI